MHDLNTKARSFSHNGTLTSRMMGEFPIYCSHRKKLHRQTCHLAIVASKTKKTWHCKGRITGLLPDYIRAVVDSMQASVPPRTKSIPSGIIRRQSFFRSASFDSWAYGRKTGSLRSSFQSREGSPVRQPKLLCQASKAEEESLWNHGLSTVLFFQLRLSRILTQRSEMWCDFQMFSLGHALADGFQYIGPPKQITKFQVNLTADSRPQ